MSETSIDPKLFKECALLVIDMGFATASLLQRNKKLGYSSATAIIDRMEELGIIGPFSGGHQRSVLMNARQVEELLNPTSI